MWNLKPGIPNASCHPRHRVTPQTAKTQQASDLVLPIEQGEALTICRQARGDRILFFQDPSGLSF